MMLNAGNRCASASELSSSDHIHRLGMLSSAYNVAYLPLSINADMLHTPCYTTASTLPYSTRFQTCCDALACQRGLRIFKVPQMRPKKSIVSSVVLACATPHSGLLKLCDPRSYQTLHQFEQESLDRLLHTVLAAAQFPLYAHAQYATSRPAVFHAGLEQPADLSICKQAKGKRCGESKEERSTPKSLTAFLRSPPDSFR